MLENPISSIIAAIVVVLSLAILGYFAWKTLIISDFFEKGINLYQAKDYKGAEAAFRKVISLNSSNDVVRLFLGDVLNQQGQIEEATELFREVIHRSPKNADAYLRLANVLIQQEQTEEAQTNLQQAKDLFQKQRQLEKAKKISNLLDRINSKSSEL
ncbi:tetratricopeptide repeat protein [aff. Roholtiella sp. LEGE 12411]|uniref:tetratricopeptide repeat protein n=1 Tax=aff. Roholtiella sp. LEGE 12411 TaxID=1828822 RepID=UPI0018816BAA|nr:tetratricopeptide repeat protein [aff. Roholtiella sp. LEGE 12411]MBE9036185.1 tetratricopeptide repeat protein [aff. Roholtiella sp. LEGE 12411]